MVERMRTGILLEMRGWIPLRIEVWMETTMLFGVRGCIRVMRVAVAC